ncbi:hypothetical protein C7446_3293 [Kushneria sinocarnis]|uniref:Heavy metal binding domain-containing protein n=2 Tax=Kushneria sinocarnis TaxID=595502 RepID=A0A420WSH1_9GAMM|nr:hypothetical protein C7446_3293 [Kushneria sinocarnis]
MHPDVITDVPEDCPQCGMHLMPMDDDGSPEHADHRHDQRYHDNRGAATPVSRGQYDNVPEGYSGTVYTCPMHPEVRQIAAGVCPLCGMGLEREKALAGEEEPNPELVDFTRRLWVAAVLTLPLLVLTMGPFVGLGVRGTLGERPAQWIELLLSTPVVLWSGWPFLVRGYRSFRTLNLNMFSLIAMGVGAAYLFSIVAVLMPDIFPAGFRDENGNVGVYFEAAAVIVALVLLGIVGSRRHRQGDPGPAGHGRQNGAGDSSRWQRGKDRTGKCPGRGSFAGASR